MTEINPKDYIFLRNEAPRLYLTKNRLLQGNNWEQQIKKLAKRKGFMTDMFDFLELRLLLDSRKKVFDGRGNLISTKEKQEILDEMVGIRNPLRGECFGNRFIHYSDEVYMESNFVVKDNKIMPLKINKIYPLMQGGFKEGLTSFKYFNENKLATKLEGKEVYYRPTLYDGYVAWFYTSSDGAWLNCNSNPDVPNLGIGVRESRKNFEV